MMEEIKVFIEIAEQNVNIFENTDQNKRVDKTMLSINNLTDCKIALWLFILVQKGTHSVVLIHMSIIAIQMPVIFIASLDSLIHPAKLRLSSNVTPL